jgi:hypothetical protein
MAHDRGSGAPRRVVRAWRRVVAAGAVAGLAGVAALIAARRKRAATGAVARTGTGMAPGLVPGHLFWTSGGSMINQANLDGSNQQAIVSGRDGQDGVAVDASHLYWANDPDGTINRANEEGNGRARYWSPASTDDGAAGGGAGGP